MTEKLKPCPVCGGKNTILMNTRGDDWDDSIDCPDCGMRFIGFETAEELIDAYNKRGGALEQLVLDMLNEFYSDDSYENILARTIEIPTPFCQTFVDRARALGVEVTE